MGLQGGAPSLRAAPLGGSRGTVRVVRLARPARAVQSSSSSCDGDSTAAAVALTETTLGRRVLLLGVASGLAAGFTGPAAAAPQTAEYEPMPGLSGKDYGKPRMRCVVLRPVGCRVLWVAGVWCCG